MTTAEPGNTTPAKADQQPGASAGERSRTTELATLHATAWLVFGNAVGVLLAILLLAPDLGKLLVPLTYGRWASVHLDVQLYGWCSLPLVALLLAAYWPRGMAEVWPRRAIDAWSGGLAVGVTSWLAGGSSGKLFLDWSGPARVFWALSLGVLAVVLAVGYGHLVRSRARSGGRLLFDGLLLLVLLSVPVVLTWAASPRIYPSINPGSGGATGGSLLGSTLGIVAILVMLPVALGLTSTDVDRAGRATRRNSLLLAVHFLAFGLLDHGDRSHHEPIQILALASLAPWVPLLVSQLRRYRWPSTSGRWLVSLGVWGAVLWLDGFVTFLPGVLEGLKFTNGLVAHAHLAMAGLATSLMVVVLQVLAAQAGTADVFAGRRAFALWHGGVAAMLGVLLVLGFFEAADPRLLFGPSTWVDTLYTLRLLAGVAMGWASLEWLAAALAPWRATRRDAATASSAMTDAAMTDAVKERSWA